VRAALHETALYVADHPLAFLFAEAVRRLGPVVRVPGIGHVVNDSAVAIAVLQDTASFTKNGPGSMGAVQTQVLGEYALLNMEGEAHRRLRGRLADLFSPAYLRLVAHDVLAAPLGDLARRLEHGESVDLVRFMRLLTGRTTCHMLGIDVDEEDAERTYLELYRLGEQLAAGIRLSTRRLNEAELGRRRRYHERLTAAVSACYERPDVRPRSVIARLRELGLTADEVRGVAAALLLAGTETLTTSLPRAAAILIDSGRIADLRDRPETIGAAIDEALRCIVPSPVMIRSVARDVTAGGHRFPAGARVLVFTYNLFKDGARYPRPHRFDSGREQPAPHLWFGTGPHFCIGFGLAQLVMRSVLQTLLASGALTIRRRRYARGVLLPGYAVLEVMVR
jgi:cytochrome P450